MANGRTATYAYDGLARLSTAVTTGSTNYAKWGLSWAYDRYGNRTDQNQNYGNPPTNHVLVSAATNRISGRVARTVSGRQNSGAPLLFSRVWVLGSAFFPFTQSALREGPLVPVSNLVPHEYLLTVDK
ncbi:MAG: hypothetical protein ACHQT6_04790 [Candidatus Acidiferrales bacterium]